MSAEYYYETPAYRCLVEHSPRLSEDLYLILCGVEICRPDKETESRIRAGYHLHVILSGAGTLKTASHQVKLHEGQMFLIRPGEKVTYSPDRDTPWTYCWMSFDGTLAADMMRQAGFTDGVYYCDSHVELNKFYELCNQTLTAPQLTPAAAARRLGLMIQYIALSIESMEYEQKNRHPKQGHPLRSKQDNIRYAMDYMDNNYSSINLKDVAEYIGINYNYFSSIFKEDQGIPPNEYLLRVRMRHSSHMLANLTMDIQDISRAVGYEDSLTFSKVFKRFFGMSPKYYREMPFEERPVIEDIISARNRSRQE